MPDMLVKLYELPLNLDVTAGLPADGSASRPARQGDRQGPVAGVPGREKLKGYGYAIIGSVGPAEFYEKCCGAVEIPESSPSILHDMLRRDRPPRQ